MIRKETVEYLFWLLSKILELTRTLNELNKNKKQKIDLQPPCWRLTIPP